MIDLLQIVQQPETEIDVSIARRTSAELGRVVIRRLDVVAGVSGCAKLQLYIAPHDLPDHSHHLAAGHPFATRQVDVLVHEFIAQYIYTQGGRIAHDDGLSRLVTTF